MVTIVKMNIVKLSSSIKNLYNQRKERGYVVNSYSANENLLNITEMTLSTLEKQVNKLLIKPVPEDIENDGTRVISSITEDSIGMKIMNLEANMILLRKYKDRLEDVSAYLKGDKTLQELTRDYSTKLNQLEMRYFTLQSEPQVTMPQTSFSNN